MIKKRKVYVPSEKILERYADVLVNFALNSGKGVKKGEVALLQVPECAKPLLIHLRRAVLMAGANPLIEYLPDGMAKEFFEVAGESQIKFFPEKYLRGKVEQIDHSLFVIAESDKHELENVDVKKIMERQKSFKPYRDWRNDKEHKGNFTWTLGLYGTEAMAKEVGMSLREYWKQIIKACYLDFRNPVKKWKSVTREVERVKDRLNKLKIEKVRIIAKNTNLVVGLGKDRKWLGGSGRNIPSFEVFISPDWKKTEGCIEFTEPLYRFGNLVKGINLKFEKGKVVEVKARSGENLLKEMISVKNANKIGEFSLTDSRLSRITKFMGETLFDENVGGKFGNTHLALGMAYKDSYPGNIQKVSNEKWEKMGYNDSAIHTDMVSTSNREVIATCANGKEIVIYKDGKFLI